jgi:hypothetical protein
MQGILARRVVDAAAKALHPAEPGIAKPPPHSHPIEILRCLAGFHLGLGHEGAKLYGPNPELRAHAPEISEKFCELGVQNSRFAPSRVYIAGPSSRGFYSMNDLLRGKYAFSIYNILMEAELMSCRRGGGAPGAIVEQLDGALFQRQARHSSAFIPSASFDDICMKLEMPHGGTHFSVAVWLTNIAARAEGAQVSRIIGDVALGIMSDFADGTRVFGSGPANGHYNIYDIFANNGAGGISVDGNSWAKSMQLCIDCAHAEALAGVPVLGSMTYGIIVQA